MRSAGRPALARGWVAALAYTLITLVMTWPLARGLGRDVAWDLGDSLLNMWILGWDSTQLAAILHGDVGRIRTFFDANIFYPEPLTLAYSEHLVGQALQALPIYLATDNPILCYNLLFLSTFVLSGLGTFLLVRELTGNHRAAFVAGLMYAFAPYRLAQSSHLQVISAQWMPFALYGLRRYFATRRRRPLAGAAAAVVMQSLSCGYYLLYFTPFAAVYALWEIAVRRAWRDARIWIELAAAAVVAAAITVPFYLPYLEVRNRLPHAREMDEVARFSADIYAYLTSSVHSRVWGTIAQAYYRVEGELFPGAMPVLLALVALVVWVAWAARREGAIDVDPPGLKTRPTYGLIGRVFRPANARDLPAVAIVSAMVAVGAMAVTVALLFERRLSVDVAGMTLRAASVTRPIVIAAVAVATAALTSHRARVFLARLVRRPEAYFLAMLVGAWWLSLGPRPTTLGRPLELAAPYAVLFEHMPGFEGVRVPARYAMIGALALAVLAGVGVAVVDRGRIGRVLVGAIALAFLAEAATLPFLVNGMSPLRDIATPEARVFRPARAPRIYGAVRALPESAVVIEFPFGHPDYDVRAVFYSTAHWRRLVNGYSGFFPPAYGRYVGLFTDIPRHPRQSLDLLRETGATHAVVHEAAYLNGEGAVVSDWLGESGADQIFRDGTDILFRLPTTGASR